MQYDLIDLKYIHSIKNPNLTLTTTLSDKKDSPQISMNELAKSIQRDGILDPLLITLSIDLNLIRLERGNHRINVFKDVGIMKAPVIVQNCGKQSVILETGNGIHTFNLQDYLCKNNLIIKTTHTGVYNFWEVFQKS
jgi:hypothetical protein